MWQALSRKQELDFCSRHQHRTKTSTSTVACQITLAFPFATRSAVKSAGISTFETSQRQKISAVDSHAKPKSRASLLWSTTCFELPLRHNSVRHYGEQRESRRKNDGEHAPIKTVARKNIVRKMSQIYADMTTAPFRILHGGKILN